MPALAMLLRYGDRTSTATPGGGWGALCLTGSCPGFWRTEQATAAAAETLWRHHLTEHHQRKEETVATAHVDATDIVNLWNSNNPNNPVLAWNGNALTIVPRVAARGSHWAIMAYQIDLKEAYPTGITLPQAQLEADHINADLAALIAAALADRG